MIAAEALARIRMLYWNKAQTWDMTAAERQACRQQRVVPALAVLKTWMEDLQLRVAGYSGTGWAADAYG